VLKRKKMRKQISGVLNQWDFSVEPGQRVIDIRTKEVFDLRESTGFGKRDAGVLTPYKVKPPHESAIPVDLDGVWYWEWEDDPNRNCIIGGA
jgi:hypothetical protein